MPLQAQEIGTDPTRTILMRAARWWWLGAILAVLVAVLYAAAARSASSSSQTVESVLFFDAPPPIPADPTPIPIDLMPEVVSRATKSADLPGSASLKLVQKDYVTVRASGSSVEQARANVARAIAVVKAEHQQVLAIRLAPLKGAAERDLAGAEALVTEIGKQVAAAAPGSAEANVSLARLLSVEDEAAKARVKAAQVEAQLARADYVRESSTGEVVAVASTFFDVAVGLVFGSVLGAVAMVACAGLFRVVRHTVDLPQHKLAGVTLVNAAGASLGADALVISGSVPVDAGRVTVVSAGGTPSPLLLEAVGQRSGEIDSFDASPTRLSQDPLAFAAHLDGASVVLVVPRGTAIRHADRLIDIVQTRATRLSAVAVTPA